MGVALLEPGIERAPCHLWGFSVDHRSTVAAACEIRGDAVARRPDHVVTTADPEGESR